MNTKLLSLRGATIALLILFALGSSVVSLGAEEPIHRFHHVSQPSFTTEVWYCARREANDASILVVPAYRHLFASVFDGERDFAIPSARSRWQAYLSIGPIVERSAIQGGHAALGWNASFEGARRVARRWFIPYLGVELGVLSFKNEPGGTASGIAGIYLFSSRRVSVSTGVAGMVTTIDPLPIAFRGMISLEVLFD
jgi:hypothetical protein